MSYVATTFTAGEVPTTAKWNQLTGNDAYFYGLLVGSGVLTSTVLSNPYKFNAYLGTNAVITSATVVPFDTKTFDTSSNLDIATNKGRFTATVPGFYWFNAAVGTLDSNNTAVAYGASLRKNGTIARNGNATVNMYTGTYIIESTVGGLLSLAAGDYVDVIFYGPGTSTVSNGAATTFFEGFFVSAT